MTDGSVDVRIEGDAVRIARAHVVARMTRVVRRLPLRPLTARVRFVDVNGPKGGMDIRCAVDLRLPRRPLVHVERLATTARRAFDGACDTLARRVDEATARWRQARRHPKKYYTARVS